MLPGHLYFKLVKTFAIDPDNVCLRDESLGIYLVDDTEDGGALAPLGHDEQHFHLVAGVEAVRLNDCSATMREDSDTRGYLLIFVGDNEELHAAVQDVHYLVYTIGGDEQHYITVDDLLEVMKNEIGRRNDDDITHHDDTSEGYVTVFVHDGGNDTELGKQRNRRTEIIITPKLDQFMDLIDEAPAEQSKTNNN